MEEGLENQKSEQGVKGDEDQGKKGLNTCRAWGKKGRDLPGAELGEGAEMGVLKGGPR